MKKLLSDIAHACACGPATVYYLKYSIDASSNDHLVRVYGDDGLLYANYWCAGWACWYIFQVQILNNLTHEELLTISAKERAAYSARLRIQPLVFAVNDLRTEWPGVCTHEGTPA